MDRRIRYHQLFDCDIREAAEWYDQRSVGLGTIFVELVESRIVEAINYPDRFARTPTGVRYVRVPRFPYVVLFDVVEDAIIFIAVLHTARDDDKLRTRRTDS